MTTFDSHRSPRARGGLARAPWSTAALLAAVLVLAPVASWAARSPAPARPPATAAAEPEGVSTALRYIGCAASIAFASSTFQAWFAVVMCTALLADALE